MGTIRSFDLCFSRFASFSGVCPYKLVWGIVRSFLGFEHVRAGGGGGVV